MKTHSRASSESTISENLLHENRCGHGGRMETSSSGNRNRLYDIEVLEEEEYRIKIHYIGYGSRYDEWIRKSELCYKPRR